MIIYNKIKLFSENITTASLALIIILTLSTQSFDVRICQISQNWHVTCIMYWLHKFCEYELNINI